MPQSHDIFSCKEIDIIRVSGKDSIPVRDIFISNE